MSDLVLEHVCPITIGSIDNLFYILTRHPRKRFELLFEILWERLIEPFMARSTLPDSVHPEVLFRRRAN